MIIFNCNSFLIWIRHFEFKDILPLIGLPKCILILQRKRNKRNWHKPERELSYLYCPSNPTNFSQLTKTKRSTGHYNQCPQSTLRLSTIYFSSKMSNTDTGFGMEIISFFPKDTSDTTKILEVKYTCSGSTFKHNDQSSKKEM